MSRQPEPPASIYTALEECPAAGWTDYAELDHAARAVWSMLLNDEAARLYQFEDQGRLQSIYCLVLQDIPLPVVEPRDTEQQA